MKYLKQRLCVGIAALGMAAHAHAKDAMAAATDVTMRLDVLTGSIQIYEAAPIRVTVKNPGPEMIRIYRAAFESALFPAGRGSRYVIPEGRVFPLLRIIRPDGTEIRTQRLILRMIASHGPIDFVLAPGGVKVWEFSVSVAWDNQDEMPIFTEPGNYELSVVAYTAAGERESAPVTLRVRAPLDLAAQRAVETIRNMDQGALWALYVPELAESWGESLDEKMPPGFLSLASDENTHPYRTYACLALARAYVSAAAWVQSRDGDVAMKDLYEAKAGQLLSEAGPDGALELAKQALAPLQRSWTGMEYVDVVGVRREQAERALAYLEKADIEGCPVRSEAVWLKLRAHRMKAAMANSRRYQHGPSGQRDLSMVQERYPDLWFSQAEVEKLEERILTEFPDSVVAYRLRKELDISR